MSSPNFYTLQNPSRLRTPGKRLNDSALGGASWWVEKGKHTMSVGWGLGDSREGHLVPATESSMSKCFVGRRSREVSKIFMLGTWSAS